MKAYGVIAEFNPLHDGHRYLLETVRSLYHPDVLVVVLSTWFSSRGLPCLQTPQTRTRLALQAGADLVIALPAVYAMQSADYFARYAIEALKTAGVSVLCFGSETGEAGPLCQKATQVAGLEADPSTSQARHAAAAGLGMRPNDILALQYIRQAAHFGMEIRPILRDQSLKSATAIRHDYFAGLPQKEDALFEARQSWDAYYPLLRYMLLETDPQQLASFFLVEEGIEHRLIRLAAHCEDWPSFLEQAITKTYSRARVQRICMMILLQISKTEMKRHSSFFTIQVLGMNPAGAMWLKSLPAGTPIYSRFRELPDWLQRVELKSSRLYSLFSSAPCFWKVVYDNEQPI